MKELSQSIIKKLSLADKLSARSVNEYYYNETVTVKHKPDVIRGLIKDHPYYTTHTELRFNCGKYSEDLGAINAEIQQYLSEISQLTSSLESLISANQTVKENQAAVDKAESGKKAAENLLKQTKANLTNYVQGLTEVQKACIVASEITNPDSEYLVETICDLGFDYNVLAAIAINNNDTSLLDFALNSGANLDTHLVAEKTLIQHAILLGNQTIISKAIAATKNFETSLFYALLQNDLSSLKEILSTHPELSSSLLFEDYSLLHYAIGNNQKDIVEYLMMINPAVVKTQNSNGDSSFKIALRSGSNDIVNILLQYVKIEEEYLLLDKKNDAALIDRANQLKLAQECLTVEKTQLLEELVTNLEHDLDEIEVSGNPTNDELNII